MSEFRRCLIPEAHRGWRLDQSLSDLFREFSRMRIQTWIKSGAVRVDQRTCKPSVIVSGGELVEMEIVLESQTRLEGEPMALDVVFDHAEVAVVNKPAGLVVHPGAGNLAGTLLNGLLHQFPELRLLPRGGIVHRLDKDTSGLMVIAKTLQSHVSLVTQLQARTIKREYLALVQGDVICGDTIDAPIGRHPRDRIRMAVVESGKPAITHYRVARRFPQHTLLHVRLETGRTHQIRVHMAHIGYPLVGDPVYGSRGRSMPGMSDSMKQSLSAFQRQALHAFALEFDLPSSGERQRFEANTPTDLDQLLKSLEAS